MGCKQTKDKKTLRGQKMVEVSDDGYVPALLGDHAIITYPPMLVANLHRVLPRRCQRRACRLVYSTRTDGVSIRTLLSRCEEESPPSSSLSPTHNNVFGAFSGTPLRVTLEARSSRWGAPACNL